MSAPGRFTTLDIGDPSLISERFAATLESLRVVQGRIAEARDTHEAAEAALREAQAADERAGIEAALQGDPDPGEAATLAARAALEDAERHLRIERLARERIEADLDAEMVAARPEAWERVEGALNRARLELVEHARGILGVFERTERLRRALKLLDAEAAGGCRAGAPSSLKLRFPEQRARPLAIRPIVEQLAEQYAIDPRTVEPDPLAPGMHVMSPAEAARRQGEREANAKIEQEDTYVSST